MALLAGIVPPVPALSPFCAHQASATLPPGSNRRRLREKWPCWRVLGALQQAAGQPQPPAGYSDSTPLRLLPCDAACGAAGAQQGSQQAQATAQVGGWVGLLPRACCAERAWSVLQGSRAHLKLFMMKLFMMNVPFIKILFEPHVQAGKYREAARRGPKSVQGP